MTTNWTQVFQGLFISFVLVAHGLQLVSIFAQDLLPISWGEDILILNICLSLLICWFLFLTVLKLVKEMYKFNQARKLLMAALQNGASNLHEESNVGDIYHINRLGMLTTDSQQGQLEYGQVPTDRALHARIYKKLWKQQWKENNDDEEDPEEILAEKIRNAYIAQGGTYKKGIILKEKAYLLGFLPVEKAQLFVQYLDQIDNVVAWLTTVNDGEEQDFSSAWVTYQPTTQDGEYSVNDRFPLVALTHVNTIRFRFSESEYGEIVHALPENDKLFAYVSIQDARFGHSASDPKDGLFAVVKRVLQSM